MGFIGFNYGLRFRVRVQGGYRVFFGLRVFGRLGFRVLGVWGLGTWFSSSIIPGMTLR